MKVKDVMSEDLIVGYVPGTVKDALSILAKHNVSGMPILKKDSKIVAGVLTRYDIFKNPDEDQIALIMRLSFDISPVILECTTNHNFNFFDIH